MIRDRITDRSRNTRLVAKPRFTMISACHKPLRYLKADQHTEHCFLTELALYIYALRTEAYHEEQHHKPTAHACEQGLPQKKERIDFFYTLFFLLFPCIVLRPHIFVRKQLSSFDFLSGFPDRFHFIRRCRILLHKF